MVALSSAEVFALARSSPWRWSTLRFTVRWLGRAGNTQQLRAWLRRPDRLRVETADGVLERIVQDSPAQVGVFTFSGEPYTATLPWWTDPAAPRPRLRADGLVAARPDGFFEVSYDAPMYQNCFGVAMLDPVELADGQSADAESTMPGTEIDTVTEVEHAGYPAWEVIVRPTPAYDPCCACCPLLRSREVDLAEAEAGAGVMGATGELRVPGNSFRLGVFTPSAAGLVQPVPQWERCGGGPRGTPPSTAR